MTLSVPSFLAADTSASMPPAAAAEVAPETEPDEPLEPPPPDPQAVRDRPIVRAATAVIRLLRRTSCPPVLARPPLAGAHRAPREPLGGSWQREPRSGCQRHTNG